MATAYTTVVTVRCGSPDGMSGRRIRTVLLCALPPGSTVRREEDGAAPGFLVSLETVADDALLAQRSAIRAVEQALSDGEVETSWCTVERADVRSNS